MVAANSAPWGQSVRQRFAQRDAPDDACVQLAANLAVFYSERRREQKCLVSCAEPKYLWKPRGAPLGAIAVRQEMASRVGFPEDVPDDIKEARKLEEARQARAASGDDAPW